MKSGYVKDHKVTMSKKLNGRTYRGEVELFYF